MNAPTSHCPTWTPLSLVIGSTLGKSSASKPLLWMSNAWHSLFTPVFHLNVLLRSASSKMLFASAKNFLPLLGPSVLQIAPWQSWEVVAKCLFALTFVFHCLETWQGFLCFSHIPLQVLPHPPGTPSPDYLPFSLSSTQLHLLSLFVLSVSVIGPFRLSFPITSDISLCGKKFSCENKYLHILNSYANKFNYYFVIYPFIALYNCVY